MSEQYPLLTDELSDEERFSPRCRRLLMSRTRAKNQVKGAAAIISRWPGQWTTLLNYWWIGIGMLAITTYFIYCCLFTYAAQESYTKGYPRPYNMKKLALNPLMTPLSPPKVFMHIFAEEKQNVDLNSYLPYIEIITNKYRNFKYQLIIVANDTHLDTKDLNDHENNKLALNSLWQSTDENKIMNYGNNLQIKHTTLSKYLYDSPLGKFWMNLPQQFLKFLVRAVSVWEKGGIAFDPIVLTPQSPNSIYIKKLYRILKKYNVKSVNAYQKQTRSSKKKHKVTKIVPNNIRDVINALEMEDKIEKFAQEPLVEVETRDVNTVAYVRKQRALSDMNGNQNNVTQLLKNTDSPKIESKNLAQERLIDTTPKLNLLPMFLNYLFHNKETSSLDETTTKSNYSTEQFLKQAEVDSQPNSHGTSNEKITHQIKDIWDKITDQNNHKPVIVSAKELAEKTSSKNVSAEKENDDSYEVTIDLKGNIIATNTACHALIGGLFSNVVHHDHSETVTEFIIKELSIFCKGLFSSCVGIDVILL